MLFAREDDQLYQFNNQNRKTDVILAQLKIMLFLTAQMKKSKPSDLDFLSCPNRIELFNDP